MRSVGLITEYNPFHNGHLHHLQESLKIAGAEVAVAVMSGHFLQRGEPALVDKWVRTQMALAAGVDLVVELPLPWACSSAPDFARGGVQALSALGVESLCFGSEAGCLSSLQVCAELLHLRGEEVAERSVVLLRQGINYPQAREQVLQELLPAELDSQLLAAPNNILGIEYLKALREIDSGIEPYTIQRIGAGYHETAVGAGNIASATGIRKRLASAKPVADLIPPAAYQPLRQALDSGQSFSAQRYLALLLAQILRDRQELKNCWLVESGIENRLQQVAERTEDLETLITGIKSRQLTRTRIQRMLVAIFLGIEKETCQRLLATGPRYLHLLGSSEKGDRFLAERRKQLSLPLVQNFSRLHSQLKRFYGMNSRGHELARAQFDLEVRASQLYTLLLKKWPGGERSLDFYRPLLRG